MKSLRRLVAIGVVLAALVPSAAEADTIALDSTDAVNGLGFPLLETPDWLLVGTGHRDFGTTVSSNSGWELGANLPLDGLVPTDLGPDVGDVTIPVGAADVAIGIGGNGDTAITDPTGTFSFQDLDGDGLFMGDVGQSGIFGDTGVECSQGATNCTDGNSNNFFNSTGTFPNVDPLSNSNGIVGGDNTTHQALRDELDAVRTTITLLDSSGSITADSAAMDLFIELNDPGFYVLDVNGSNDWNLGDYDILIDGVAGSSLIFRLNDTNMRVNDTNMLVSNSFIGIGDRGIGLHNVLFYTNQDNDNGHFNLSNVVLNGVAFWDLSVGNGLGSDLAIGGNSQGCTQLISEQIVLNNVRYNNCGFNPQVPEPSTLLLIVPGLAMVGIIRRRQTL